MSKEPENKADTDKQKRPASPEFKAGFSDGFPAGYREAMEYERGFSKGFAKGFRKGLERAENERLKAAKEGKPDGDWKARYQKPDAESG